MGMIHELAHYGMATIVLLPHKTSVAGWSGEFWYHLILGRKFVVWTVVEPVEEEEEGEVDPWQMDLIRHAGWMVSCLVALGIDYVRNRGIASEAATTTTTTTTTWSCALQWAACVTAAEALWTDLLQWPILPIQSSFLAWPAGGGAVLIPHVFACGNFGMLLLHPAWWRNQHSDARDGPAALSILETLIQVTMMRGAQSGGVVCFHPRPSSKTATSTGQDSVSLVGVRSRVVNRKRTDLSVLLRHKVAHDNGLLSSSSWLPTHRWFSSGGPFPTDSSPVFCGHTRFATSSKATLPDTQFQQWTPPSPRRVYPKWRHDSPKRTPDSMSSSSSSSSPTAMAKKPRLVPVEHYITHNGDLEFYRLHGQTVSVDAIQTWLEHFLQYPRPGNVDSGAIAGLVDLIRTQACFGTSVRYALCLGMERRDLSAPWTRTLLEFLTPTNNNESTAHSFPSYRDLERIGGVFEHVLTEMLKTTDLNTIDQSPSVRASFAWRVVSKLRARTQELLQATGVSHFLQDLQETEQDDPEDLGGTSLFSFCLATIHAFLDNDLLFTTQTILAHASGSFGLCVTSSLDAHRQVCLAARGQTMSVAFYPRKGLVLYGSEQAAVKAGLGVPFPGNAAHDLDHSLGDVDNDALRLDLDGT